MVYFGWLFLGLLIGAGVTYYFARFGRFGIGLGGSKTKVVTLVTSHFKPVAIDNVTTVSYTHLRAHETKANLVCRLLLEKKKKK